MELRNAAPGSARSEATTPKTRMMLGARACITLSHTPANCRGLGPAASPSHPTGTSGRARPYAGPRGQVNASDGGGRKSQGHPPPLPIAENLKPPGLDRRKAFLWEPPVDHVTDPATNRLLPLPAASLSARPAAPASFAQPLPFPAASPRLRSVLRAPSLARAPRGARRRRGG